MELDAVDRAIIDLLQRDGRITNAELAARVHLSASACLRRVRRLEEGGVIDRYVMLVNPAAVDRTTDVFVEISLSSQRDEVLDAFERAVAASPAIMACYLMAGDSDYLVRLKVAGVADYERVHRDHLSKLPGVARMRSSFALRTVYETTEFRLD
ncbi:MAG: Lrp/AsnC family transcriptional regulator [Acidimicrobiia bacterium]|nr:Lrp/AsnC family transcriptional regulator [Acidimicrobiia bacterium]MDH4309856.1 Lrp/AsnC family transcriptional regulator [Acidimicrobiia bacterium]